MALTSWGDILNKPNGVDEVPEIVLTVEQLSASVLSISEDVGEIAEDVQEIALEVSNLSASTLPYSSTQSTKEAIDEITDFEEETFINVVSLGTIGQNRITKKGKIAVCVLNTWGSETYTEGQVIAKIPPSISPIAYNYGMGGFTINGVNYTAPIDIINGDVKAPAPGAYTKMYLVATILCR